MKKMVKNFAAFACGALVAMSFAACTHHNEELGIGASENSTNKTEYKQTIKTSKTLIVVVDNALPAGAKLTYAGKEVTPSGLTYTFDNVEDGKNLVLAKGTSNLVLKEDKNGSGKTTIKVNFGSKNVLIMNINITLASAGTPITTAAEGATDNDKVDDNTTGTVTISAAAAAKIIGKTLSATMFAPLQNSLLSEDKIKKDEDVQATPYAISCEPDGAVFDPETATITAFLEKGAGCEVELHDPDGNVVSNAIVSDKGADATLTAEVKHFSIWDIIMKLQITGVEDGEEVVLSKELAAGTKNVSYQEKFGFAFVDKQWEGKNIITRTFNALFGATETKVNKEFSFQKALTTTTNIEIKQKYKIVSLKSGKQTFVVKLWGTLMPATLTVNVDRSKEEPTVPEQEDPEVPQHNGGGND